MTPVTVMPPPIPPELAQPLLGASIRELRRLVEEIEARLSDGDFGAALSSLHAIEPQQSHLSAQLTQLWVAHECGPPAEVEEPVVGLYL